jgi:hypothetical protein
MGQPAAASPVAPPSGRTGFLVVPAVLVAVALVVGGLVSLPTVLGPVLAVAGLTGLAFFRATPWGPLTGDLQLGVSLDLPGAVPAAGTAATAGSPAMPS